MMPDETPPPRLETERLILRGWRAADFEPFAAMMAEPEVARFLTVDQAPQDRIAAWRSAAIFIGHWTLKTYGMFVVEEKESGAFVGRVGPWNPEGWPGFELGWGISRAFWGRGYAHEAAVAAGHWAFATLALDEAVSLIHVDNVRSQNLAARLGEQPGRAMFHAGMPHVIWTVSREAWFRTNPLPEAG